MCLAACGSGSAGSAAELVAVGASSQMAAMDGWKAALAEDGAAFTVAYDPIGSGGGREAFLSGAADLAASDLPLDEGEAARAVRTCAGDRGAIDLPVYVSPIVVVYHLPEIAGSVLRLTPTTLAGIFAGTITRWDDAGLAAVNPGLDLPDRLINPVHRSDDSGTTENFTAYLAAEAPDVWTYGAIQAWSDGPRRGEGADGTAGVVQAVLSGAGSIGYADASQARGLPVAALEVAGGFVEYTPEAAAAVVAASPLAPDRNPFDFAFELRRDVPDTYPLVLVSYLVACLDYDDAETAARVRQFLELVVSARGQAAATLTAGSAPLAPELAAGLAEAIAAIGVAAG